MAGLGLFLKYFLVDRDFTPNADRYWKRILLETQKSLWWWRSAGTLRPRTDEDSQSPRYMAWNMVIWGRKAKVTAE